MLWAVPNNNDMGLSGVFSLKGLEIVRVRGLLDAAALVYAPEEHGLLVPAAFYRARDGVAHQVCVNLHPEVGWRIIDLAATFVARLEGADDLRPSAVACARDYARQYQLFHAGLRESPPILRPTSVTMRWPSSPADERPETVGD
ncbi:MAG TPA: hypothetical protein VGI24_12795 [Solirubrobacteraceae bacterium]|jgi:hypothetical protein